MQFTATHRSHNKDGLKSKLPYSIAKADKFVAYAASMKEDELQWGVEET